MNSLSEAFSPMSERVPVRNLLGKTDATPELARLNQFPPTPSHELDDSVTGTKDAVASPELAKHVEKSLNGLRTAPTYLTSVTEHDRRLKELVPREDASTNKLEHIVVTGDDLSIAEVTAVACFKVPVRISQDVKVQRRVDESVEFLTRHLEEGHVVYGINTGYGGSADTRSQDLVNMQRGLIQHQNSAVLLPSDMTGSTHGLHSDTLSSLKSHALPRSVVRGSMLARCNSLMRGHSAVRLDLIYKITELLNRDFIPIIPLRGSISASGDLTPLSYIAGALEGNPDIYMDCNTDQGKREILNASEALKRAGLSPTIMLPKEGLGLMNGTAVSSAAASLVLHETQYLALATQVLTGMCTEALRGSNDNYHPFVSNVRPHAGQMQVAENIRRQLKNSKLVVGTDARLAGLYQDRYALRTSPQWIGPQLEDLSLAQQQVSVEINSTTDNPLVDVANGHVHHGGNFQAASVTSAMEKTRLALQMLGKLMFSQTSELINPMLNNTLTPNLAFDDPDISFSFKGVDINMAAYMSELAYLANPVSSHVQSAEMHNQAVNSLALISTRYAMDAVEVVSLMVATYLFTVCQGLDLHVLHLECSAQIEKKGKELFQDLFGQSLIGDVDDLSWKDIFVAIQTGLVVAKSKGVAQRARVAAEATIIPLTKALSSAGSQAGLQTIAVWVDKLDAVIASSMRETRERFAKQGPSTLEYLGNGSAIMYRYIRQTLRIPLHRGLVEHPTYPGLSRDEISLGEAEDKKTIGSRIGVIYAALRSGELGGVFIECLS